MEWPPFWPRLSQRRRARERMRAQWWPSLRRRGRFVREVASPCIRVRQL